MKLTCTGCKKTYNFKSDKLPDQAFSFGCKECGAKIRVTQEQIEAAKKAPPPHNAAGGGTKAKAGGNKAAKSMPRLDPEKLKKPVMKLVGLVSRLSGRSERDWLFSLTKFSAIFSITALVILIVVGGFTYFAITGNQEVTYSEVERSLNLKMDPTLGIESAAPGVKLSGRVRKYLGGDYRETFVGWMNGLEDHQKADFVDNLDRIIVQAQKLDPEHIYDFINEYKSLKYTRSVEKPYARYLFKLGVIVVLIAMIVLLGLFCLILLQLTWQKTVLAPESPKPAAKKTTRRSLVKKRAPQRTGSPA